MTWSDQTYSGWGRALSAEGALARPERMASLDRLCADGAAPAIGARRSYGDACLNSGGRAIDMTRLDRFLGFDANTGALRVEAGASLASICETFLPKGWMPTVLPGSGFVTVGGAIANDVHGKNHHEKGSFGQHVTSLRLRTPDGKRHDLKPKDKRFIATCGGLGQTGVIEDATISLMQAPSQWLDVSERRMPGLDAFLDAFDESDSSFSVGWINALAYGTARGRGIFEEAEFSASNDPAPDAKTRGVPFEAPGFLLSPTPVKLFNAAYFNRVPAGGRTRLRDWRSFFCPLDGLLAWNRLYGKSGFHQFQAVLPFDAARETLNEMLELVADTECASPLAVLKKMGAGRAGLMSFPMEGYTLALDLPNRDDVLITLRRLTDMTLDAGGRVYLAKDSSAAPSDMRPMYPELSKFRKIADSCDPHCHLETDLTRRLALRRGS